MGSGAMMMPGLQEADAGALKDDIKSKMSEASKPILDLIFDFLDKNKDGTITKQEFVAASATMDQNPAAAVDALFQVVDDNKNGKIETAEASEFIAGLADVAAGMAEIAIQVFAGFLKGPAVQQAVMMMFGVVDTDQDGMITLEEAHAVADPVLAMATGAYQQFMQDQDGPFMPPQVVAIRNYIKKFQDETIPQLREAMQAKLPMEKDAFVAETIELNKSLLGSDFMVQSLTMNPQLAMLPPPIMEVLTNSLTEVTDEVFEALSCVTAAGVDLYTVDGTVTAEQFEVMTSLFLPTGTPEEKFDAIWGLIDTDKDGKITGEEATAFVGKVFDMVVAFAVGISRMYKVICAKILSKVVSVVIDSTGDGTGLTQEQIMGLAANPEQLMAIAMGAGGTASA